MNPLATLAMVAVLALPATAQGPTCTSSLLGAGCGPSLTITFTPVGGAGNHTIEVSASGLHQNGLGVMAWGVTQLNVPLGGGCSLLTSMDWGHIVNLDATGSFSWSRSWPASVIGFYNIQFGSVVLDPFNNLQILTSDCKRAECF